MEGEFGFARAFHEVQRACGLALAGDLDLEGKGKDCHRKRPPRQSRRWRGCEPRAAAFVITRRRYRGGQDGDRHGGWKTPGDGDDRTMAEPEKGCPDCSWNPTQSASLTS